MLRCISGPLMINICSNMLLLFCSNTQTVAEVRLINNTHCSDSLVTGYDKQFFLRKTVNIFLPIILTYVLDAQKNRLIETVLLSHPQHMFWLRNKKINFCYILLTKALFSVQ